MIGTVPERRDRFLVVTCKGTVVEISLTGLDEIVAALRRDVEENRGADISKDRVLRALESAGGVGRVKLDEWYEANLTDLIRTLAKRLGGESHLDPGVAKLYRTLNEEIRARWAEEDAKSVVLQVSAWFRERGFLLTLCRDEHDPQADCWVNLHRIADEGDDPVAILRRLDHTMPAMPRYAQGRTDEEAATRARERYEREQ